jgi:hypothetical protein
MGKVAGTVEVKMIIELDIGRIVDLSPQAWKLLMVSLLLMDENNYINHDTGYYSRASKYRIYKELLEKRVLLKVGNTYQINKEIAKV